MKLSEVAAWAACKKSILERLDKMEQMTVADAFKAEVNRGCPVSLQKISFVSWQSVGFINDKWKAWLGKNNDPSKYEQFVINNLHKDTPEEARARAEKEKLEAAAQALIDTWEAFLPIVDYKTISSNDKLKQKTKPELLTAVLTILKNKESKDSEPLNV